MIYSATAMLTMIQYATMLTEYQSYYNATIGNYPRSYYLEYLVALLQSRQYNTALSIFLVFRVHVTFDAEGVLSPAKLILDILMNSTEKE